MEPSGEPSSEQAENVPIEQGERSENSKNAEINQPVNLSEQGETESKLGEQVNDGNAEQLTIDELIDENQKEE